MSDDAELLRRYAADHSEAAFAELVQRHVNLVYSAALRLVNGDTHRAQDVTQQVFTELARQARHLTKHPALLGWVYTTTRRTALRAIRTEQRRQVREQEANVMNELLREPTASADWERLRPVLEDAMHGLGEKDRMALLLRFFQNKSLRDIGAALGLNENAARMRVDRALEKLRAQLARKGITSTTSALALALAGNAVIAAPPAFAATVASASLAGVASGTGTTLTLLKVMAMTKTQFGVTALVLTGAAITLIVQHQSQTELREQNRSLQQQVAQLRGDNETLSGRLADARMLAMPHLPAPPVTVSVQVPLEELHATNLYLRMKDYTNKLTLEQVAGYLDANHRNAASLLAAYRSTGDVALLEEAMRRFPNDPQVAFEAMYKKNVSPEEKRQWLDAMKKSAPDNAFANCLSALDYFKSGQTDQAIQELMATYGQKQFEDYTLERMQNDEEAYLTAGFSAAEAKTLPSQQLLLPQLPSMKELGNYLVDLSKSYRNAGDPASAQAALQLLANLGQRTSESHPAQPEITQLVGMAVERMALNAMDPNTPYGDNGQRVQDRINELLQQKDALRAMNQQLDAILRTLPEQDWISYRDRWRTFGEEAALRWLIGKYGQK